MANELTEITKAKKDLMRGLHLVYGFNFEKPYRVAKVCTPTTIGAMRKAVAADKDDTVVVLAPSWRHSATEPKDWLVSTTIYAVELDPMFPQGFDVTRAGELRRYECRTINAFDYYFEKKDFTEARQNYNSAVIVIAQARKLQFRYTNPDKFKARKQNKTDGKDEPTNIRQRIIRIEDHSYGLVIEYRRMDTNANYKTDCVTAYPDDDEKVTDLIDKSGYLVKTYRNALKKRAEERRAEIKRQEVLKMDLSGRVTTLREVITRKQNALADALRFASTSTDLEKVRNDLCYWHGLLDTMRDFEEFVDNVENKSFSSVGACDALYNRILDNIINNK